jgi:integrase
LAIIGQPKTGTVSVVQGNIRRRGADSWQVRVSLGRDPETGRYRYVGRYVQGTKRDAQRAAAELITEVDRGGHREEGRHTVNELLDRWMAHIEAQGRAESTLARYRSCINANIKPRLGAKAINKLGPADIDRYYGHLGRTGLTPLSVRKSHAILSAAFNQALRWGWLDTNPVLRSSPPTQRAREIHPPTREELRRLLEACANDHEDLGSLTYVATTTGARRGELCGLRWSDLDLDLATLTIARSISDANQLVAVKDTKTHQARRIALDPSTVKVLRAHRERVDQRAAMADIGLSPTPTSGPRTSTAPPRTDPTG